MIVTLAERKTARVAMQFDSDGDILVDLPWPALSKTWSFAEGECARCDFAPDVLPLPWMTDAVIERLSRRDGVHARDAVQAHLAASGPPPHPRPAGLGAILVR